MIRVKTIVNGVEISGTTTAMHSAISNIESGILSILPLHGKDAVSKKKWWQDETYFSLSKCEDLDVVDMDTSHIANAAAKILREESGISNGFLANLLKNIDGKELIQLLTNDNEIRSLLSELCERIEENEL